MSELIECLDGLTAENILKRAARTANGVHFYINTMGLSALYPQYQAVYDLFGTEPSAAMKTAQNEMVGTLVDNGLWENNIDLFHLGAMQAEADSFLNWKSPGNFTLTKGHRGGGTDPAWTANRGWHQNTNQGYLSTNWNPASDAVLFQQNSGGCFIASFNDIDENKVAYGVVDAASFIRTTPNNGGSIVTYLMSGFESNPSGGTSKQHLGIRKIDANNLKYDINGVQASDAIIGDTIPNGNWYILAYNDVVAANSASECNNIIMYHIITNGMDDAKATLLQSTMETYLDVIGSGLIP